MAENRWIDSEEALAFGLVDEIRRPSEREKETSIVDFIAREGSHLAALSLPIPFVKENKGVKVLKVLRVLKALNPLKVEDMEEEKKEEKEEVKTVKEDDFARLEEAVNGMLAVQEKQEERLAALEALVKELEEKPAPPSDPVEVEDSYGLQQVAALDERAAKEETPRDRLSRIASIL